MDIHKQRAMLARIQRLIWSAPYGYGGRIADIWMPAHDGKITIQDFVSRIQGVADKLNGRHPDYAQKLRRAVAADKAEAAEAAG